MSADKQFPLRVGITLAGGLVIAAGIVFGTGMASVFPAIVVGAVLSTVNVLSGYAAIEYSIGKPHTTFLAAVLGGMGVRLVSMLGVLALLVRFTALETLPLVASVMVFYVVYLILEIIYIQKRVSHLEQSSH